MRPRVFPAEDSSPPSLFAFLDHCFNEAAGIPRGRLRGVCPPPVRRRCFNEAAGIPRGRRDGSGRAANGPAASMRPRVFPAEDVVVPRPCPRPEALQ